MSAVSYDGLSRDAYKVAVNTPSTHQAYYERFHKPVIEEAKDDARGQLINLLDLACGHGFELDFVKDDPRLRIFGVDLSAKTIAESTQPNIPQGIFQAADVENVRFFNVMHVGIMVNSLIYKHKQMLTVLFDALRPGAKAVSNFPVTGRPANRPFVEYYLAQGATLRNRGDDDIRIAAEPGLVELEGIDYRTASNEAFHPFGVQAYFREVADAKKLIKDVGFELVDHQVYTYDAPACKGLETDVFTLRKPAA